jgi:hypothetical protein
MCSVQNLCIKFQAKCKIKFSEVVTFQSVLKNKVART